ncbi:hypothetical protein Tco_1260714 [Tanacetum coccineum]
MSLYTNLQEKVLDLEKAKIARAKEITNLKKRVKQLEKRRKLIPSGLRRLRKVSLSSRVESSNDAIFGAQEDASKHGMKIEDLDADVEVTLVNETQEMNDDNLMFDTGVLEEQEIKFEKVVEEPVVSAATTTKSILISVAEVVTTASASVVIPDELTLAQTLIEIKTAKPKPITTVATTVTSLQPELIEEERLARKKEKEANIALIESWDNTQAMMETDFELAQRLQAEEQGEITIEERSRLFIELMHRRKKHFAKLRAESHLPKLKIEIKLVKGSETRIEESSKREGEELESDMSKKQKIDEHGIDREDLETLWKLVKAKHENTRPEEDYERVLWGDLNVMFEPDIKSEVWRNLQGYKVTVWKLFDNCGVHFVRFRNLHIFMLVEKRYPLTPITISNMLNKKLQADRWNEMCYQLLKLMTKQEKGQ